MSAHYKEFKHWLEEQGIEHSAFLEMSDRESEFLIEGWLKSADADGRTIHDRICGLILSEPDASGRFHIEAAPVAEAMMGQAQGAQAWRDRRKVSGAGVWQHPGTDIITAEELHIPVECLPPVPPADADPNPKTDEEEDPRDDWENASAVVCYLVLGIAVAVFGSLAYRAGWAYWAKFLGGLWP